MSEEENTQTTEAGNESQQADSSQEQDNSWGWNGDIKGSGERPDWLPTKYKTVEDAAKARGELEKKLGSFTGAPDEYKLDDLNIDTDQHVVKELISVAKEMNMSQAGLEKFIDRLATSTEAETQATIEDHVKNLGENGERIMRQYDDFTSNHLKPEEKEVVKSWIQSADDLKMFTNLVSGIYKSSVPIDNFSASNHAERTADITSEMAKNAKRYDTDAVYRKDIRSRLERAAAIEKRMG